MFKKKLLKKIFVPTLFLMAFLFFFSNSSAHQWIAPQKASKMKNPISYSETSVEQGKVIYSKNCVKCHGVNAGGLSPKLTGLKKWTSNLILGLKNHTDGDFFWKIQNGKGAMPSFRNELSDEDIWNLINFIKSLDNKTNKTLE